MRTPSTLSAVGRPGPAGPATRHPAALPRRASLAAALALALWAISTLGACETVSVTAGLPCPGCVGAPCSSKADCTQVSDPTCLKIGPQGYCATSCSWGQFECPDEAICQELGDRASYCMDGCLSAADCFGGFRCAPRPDLAIYQDGVGVCLLACAKDADCETGMRCDTASGECVARVGANAGVGAACTSAAQCNSGLCLTAEQASFPDGYCSASCGTQLQSCEPGSACYELTSGVSVCLKSCGSDGDCRQGYFCDGEDAEHNLTGGCVPRCDSDGQCGDGLHCDATSGACLAGAGAPGPVGSFCAGASDCISGNCASDWPNGYCTTAPPCDVTGPNNRCLAGCTSDYECRSGYACGEAGGCVPKCQSNAECSGGQVCDPASGRCVQPAAGSGSVDVAGQGTLSVGTSGSDDFVFSVPSDAVSATILMSNSTDDLTTVLQLTAPNGTVLYDFNSPYSSRMYVFPSDRVLSVLLPNSPSLPFPAGDYRVSFLKDGATTSGTVKVLLKRANGLPTSGTLDVHIYFAHERLNAGNAANNNDFQRTLNGFAQIYQNAGITLRSSAANYHDIDRARFRVIEDTEGAQSELAALFAQSQEQGNALNFFIVDEILGGSAGYIILGVAGGIPGPPTVHGTVHSGVAVSVLDVSDSQTNGQTMAHEGGHFLGLFHTSESSGDSHDPLGDTPQCTNDSNNDGYVTNGECGGRGAENFMFWEAASTATQVSADQRFVLLRNPNVQ